MSYVVFYIASLVVFLSIDAVWIGSVMKPLFQANIAGLLAERVRFGVAAGFYAFYVAGLVYFAGVPALSGGGWSIATLNGALLGLLAYGTYEATNMATLRGWTWTMVCVDTLWGTVLTGVAALAGYWAARAFGYAMP